MDPITIAITGALANLGVTVINDAYEALKTALQHKYGINGELADAVKNLEDKPSSEGRQIVLQEEIEEVGANQDPDIKKLAETLLAEIEKVSGQAGGTTTTIRQKARDHATQIGTVGGNVNIGKEGKQ